MLLTRGMRNSFKVNTVVLSYMSSAKKTNYYPTTTLVMNELPRHFSQEFALDARIYDRFKTYGAKNEEEFIRYMGDGRYIGYIPNQYEVSFILDQLQLAHFDQKGHAQNSTLQEVW